MLSSAEKLNLNVTRTKNNGCNVESRAPLPQQREEIQLNAGRESGPTEAERGAELSAIDDNGRD